MFAWLGWVGLDPNLPWRFFDSKSSLPELIKPMKMPEFFFVAAKIFIKKKEEEVILVIASKGQAQRK